MQAPGYYPVDEEFGYSVETHTWVFCDQTLTDEEAEAIYQQKMAERQTNPQLESEAKE
jgi:hypothetical protein